MRIALIPARGGSKGIKNKNLQLVGNYCLVEHAILDAKKTKLFDQIYLSTDNSKIAEKGIQHDIQIIRRPKSLALDTTLISEVIMDHIEFLKLNPLDQIWMLQPTALFRSKDHFQNICSALSYKETSNQYGFSVRQVHDFHPARMYSNNGTEFSAVCPSKQHFRRQDLEVLFLRDGLFYYSSVEALKLNNGAFFGPKPICIDLKKSYYANVDTHDDLEYARFLFSRDLV